MSKRKRIKDPIGKSNIPKAKIKEAIRVSKKRTKYPVEKAGHWIFPVMTGYKLKCCDCGLVHHIDFAVVDEKTYEPINGNKVIFRAYRMNKKGEIAK